MILKQNSKINLYNKLFGALIKNGKKAKAKKILDKAFSIASIELNTPINIILLKIFQVLNTYVEVKTVLIKRRAYTIPFVITLPRRVHLAIKWLINAIFENKKKTSFTVKLSVEIINILKFKVSKALSFKQLNNKQAILNRSNIHYRW